MTILGVHPVDAQREGGNAHTPKQIVERLYRKLNLTDEQEKHITALYSDFFQQKLSRDERKTAMQELNKKIEALLTDEQKTAFEQMKKERPKRKR